jgi:hypothetical protein
MAEPINDRELPEELMSAMLRYEEEAYRAGQHGCCEDKGRKYENPSTWKACEKHGPRCRASLTLLCHALAQWAEEIVEEAARAAAYPPALQRVRALAAPCPKCNGYGHVSPGGAYCDCSRGKAFAHWARLESFAPSQPSPSAPGSDHDAAKEE